MLVCVTPHKAKSGRTIDEPMKVKHVTFAYGIEAYRRFGGEFRHVEVFGRQQIAPTNDYDVRVIDTDGVHSVVCV